MKGGRNTVSARAPRETWKKGKGHGETSTEGDAANECGWLIDAGTVCMCVAGVGGGGWFLVRH